MKYNLEEMIDRYFDGQLSASEQTDLLSQVAGDPVAQQLFDAEQFIRGAFTHDLSAVPQAAMEPSASLLAKLSATKPLASQSVSQGAQEVTRESVAQTVASKATTVAVKGTSALTGKVAVGTIATAGKTIMGLSVGAFQFMAGAIVTAALVTGVIVSSNNSTPDDQQVIAPLTDSANVLTVDNKIDTPITVSASPVTPIEPKESRVKTEVTTNISGKPATEPVDLINELPAPRVNQDPVAKVPMNTKASDKPSDK